MTRIKWFAIDCARRVLEYVAERCYSLMVRAEGALIRLPRRPLPPRVAVVLVPPKMFGDVVKEHIARMSREVDAGKN